MLSAIILAAGTSSRMGTVNKLLLPYQDKALVCHIHDTLAQVDFGEIITVLGHEADAVKTALKGQAVKFVFNPNYQQGMTSSIQAGVQACHPNTNGFMIFLSDLVLLQAKDIQQLVKAFHENYTPEQALILVPTNQGKKGHPISFSQHFKTAILEHQAPNGCKEIVQTNKNAVLKYELNTTAILRDVDTPEDFDQLLNDTKS